LMAKNGKATVDELRVQISDVDSRLAMIEAERVELALRMKRTAKADPAAWHVAHDEEWELLLNAKPSQRLHHSPVRRGMAPSQATPLGGPYRSSRHLELQPLRWCLWPCRLARAQWVNSPKSCRDLSFAAYLAALRRARVAFPVSPCSSSRLAIDSIVS